MVHESRLCFGQAFLRLPPLASLEPHCSPRAVQGHPPRGGRRAAGHRGDPERGAEDLPEL